MAGEALQRLGGLSDLIFRALDAGATKTRSYSHDLCDNEKPEPFIRETIVRHQTRRFLRKNGINAEEDAIDLADEPLVSVLIQYRGVAVRILKANDGVPPGCGKSERRKGFYGQTPVSKLNSRGKVVTTNLNLLYLWDFDELMGIGRVQLACPIVGAERSRDIECYWIVPLQHPAENATIQTVASDEDDDLKAMFTDAEDDTAEKSGS